jgi:N-acetylmuramoyl-L-alanine amidase
MRRRAAGPAGRALIRISLERRRLCQWLVVPATQFCLPSAWAQAAPSAPVARVGSLRVWPAQEYTRVVVESNAPIPHHVFALRNPDRLVLDLDGIDLSSELVQLPARIQASDPYIAGARLGRKTVNVVRVVFDLKSEVRPDLFALAPVADFGHRLVLDLYPLVPLDPLMALLESERHKDRGDPSAKGPSGPPKPEGRLASRPITIAIDPGHGGEDPGVVGRRGTFEKDVVLAIARKLKGMVDTTPGMRAMLTRDDDYFVPLRERVQKARRVQADLFISIHADAFREARARGSSVFALSENGATSAAARWLAQKENEADLIGGVDLDRRDPLLARTLLDLSQTAQISDSLKVGRHVLDGISMHNTLHKANVEQAGFAVLKAPDIPSILVETAFISNPDEELKLRSERHQRKFAESIHEGISRYFARNPPLARA